MRHAYLLGLLLVPCSAATLGEEFGDAQRYKISCEGEVIYDDAQPDTESFTWFVDEASPVNEQIFHNGKSVCEGTLSCTVEIKPYQIRVRTVKEGTELGRQFTGEWDGTINRVYGTAKVTASVTEVQGEVVKRYNLKGTYLCDRHPVHREI